MTIMLGICKFCHKNFHKREKSRIFCSQICSNRYNLNGLNKVILPRKSLFLAEFIGICLGDGYASGYQSGVTLNSIADKEYVPYVEKLVRKLFVGAGISVTKRKENAVDIRINSKQVVNFLKQNGVVSNAKYVPDWILKNPNYVLRCVRGLIDTEGSISFKVYKGSAKISVYKQLNFRNFNIELMIFIRDSIANLGLKPTSTLKHSLYLSNDRSIAVYTRLVGFSNPKLLTRSLITDITSYEKWLGGEGGIRTHDTLAGITP